MIIPCLALTGRIVVSSHIALLLQTRTRSPGRTITGITQSRLRRPRASTSARLRRPIPATSLVASGVMRLHDAMVWCVGLMGNIVVASPLSTTSSSTCIQVGALVKSCEVNSIRLWCRPLYRSQAVPFCGFAVQPPPRPSDFGSSKCVMISCGGGGTLRISMGYWRQATCALMTNRAPTSY